MPYPGTATINILPHLLYLSFCCCCLFICWLKYLEGNPRHLVILTLQFQYVSIKNMNIVLNKHNVISHWTKLSNPIHIKFHEHLKMSSYDLKNQYPKSKHNLLRGSGGQV